MRIVVVFPDPLGPMRAVTEPRGTARSRPVSACWPPKDLASPTTSTASEGHSPPAWVAVRDSAYVHLASLTLGQCQAVTDRVRCTPSPIAPESNCQYL